MSIQSTATIVLQMFSEAECEYVWFGSRSHSLYSRLWHRYIKLASVSPSTTHFTSRLSSGSTGRCVTRPQVLLQCFYERSDFPTMDQERGSSPDVTVVTDLGFAAANRFMRESGATPRPHNPVADVANTAFRNPQLTMDKLAELGMSRDMRRLVRSVRNRFNTYFCDGADETITEWVRPRLVGKLTTA